MDEGAITCDIKYPICFYVNRRSFGDILGIADREVLIIKLQNRGLLLFFLAERSVS